MYRIRRFLSILESIINIRIPNWNIRYNHGTNHDLDDRLMKRVGISELDFEQLLNRVVSCCENDKISGDWIFISIPKNTKIITNVYYINRKIYIVTILGKKENTKKQKNFKLI
jgi:hypothetical protein